MKEQKKIIVFLFMFIGGVSFSQDITYKPTSMFFGGTSFNSQQILASANAQNDFQEKNENKFEQPSDIENFTKNLNKQLLNGLSQSLFQQQIGSAEDLTVGTYVFGSLVVEVTPAVDGLSVSILNTTTGEQTQITIPGG